MTEEEKPQIDSIQMLEQIIAKLTEQNREQMMEFARELKKPTEREQRKIDEEDARLVRSQNERLALAKAELDRQENNRLNCPHANVNPITGVSVHMWRAQSHIYPGQQPYFVPTCQRCHTQKRPDGSIMKIASTPDMLTQGVELHRYAALNYETLLKMSEQYKA